MYLVAKIIQKIKLLRALIKPFTRNVSNTKPSFVNNRFYPNEIPYHMHEPSRDHFDIVNHSLYGEGVIAIKHFQANQILFRFNGKQLHYQTLFTLQKKPGSYIEDPYFMGKILHSCDPNAQVDMDLQVFIALRTIEAGQFIRMDYETTEDKLFRQFDCKCGSNHCRGWISGRISEEKGRSGDTHI